MIMYSPTEQNVVNYTRHRQVCPNKDTMNFPYMETSSHAE